MYFLQKLIILKDKIINHGAEHNLFCFQSPKGRFFVLYNDGERSINMAYSTAKDYAEMFGGVVYHISQKL